MGGLAASRRSSPRVERVVRRKEEKSEATIQEKKVRLCAWICGKRVELVCVFLIKSRDEMQNRKREQLNSAKFLINH